MIVATPKTAGQLDAMAKELAELICSIQIDQRSDFYAKLAVRLGDRGQGFQARLFERLAKLN